jgi:lysophospholipase L1-like esterase
MLTLAACTTSAPPDPDAVLAIGDSIMAWNDDQGIPEVTAAALEQRVVDASVSGARLQVGSGVFSALGFDITRQWANNAGRWDWVLLDGGGNDLQGLCATPAEGEALARIIADDLTGALPDLIAQVRASGSKVAVIGYYDNPEAGQSDFTTCQFAFDRMNERLTRLAARDAGMVFLDTGTVIDPANTGLYETDFIHPSVEGSRLIGEALAQAIKAAR